MVNNKKNKRKKGVRSTTLEYRTKAERKYEGDKIILQMKTDYGLVEKIPSIRLLYSKIYEFIETGESVSGKIPYPVDNRIIDYTFSNNSKVKPCINVKLLVVDRSKVKEIIKQ